MVGVLLGLPGNWAEEELEYYDHYTTKIDGLPDWPPLPNDVVRPELLNCCSCGSRLSLLAQVYAPVSNEHTLYIFGCLVPNCGTSEQSWRDFSTQKAMKEKKSNDIADSPTIASPVYTPLKSPWLDESDGEDEEFDFASLGKALEEAND